MTKEPVRPASEFFEPEPKEPSGYVRAIVMGLAILAILVVAAMFLGIGARPVVVRPGEGPAPARPIPTPVPVIAPIAPILPDGLPADPPSSATRR